MQRCTKAPRDPLWAGGGWGRAGAWGARASQGLQELRHFLSVGFTFESGAGDLTREINAHSALTAQLAGRINFSVMLARPPTRV